MFGNGASLRRPGCFSTAPGRNPSVAAVTTDGRGRGRGRPAGVEQPEDGQAPKDKKAPPRRLSKILQQYEKQNVEEQVQEVDRYAQERAEAILAIPTARDGRPKLRAAKAKNYVKGTTEIEKKRAQMFTYNYERREDEPNIGVYGKGKSCWWALRVNPGREKQVADGIDRLLKYLPSVRINGEDKPDIVREAECWAPAKKVRAWSPKTGKMGTKSLKYDDGGFLLVKTIMDKPFITMLNGNINVLGFQDREVYEGVLFPRPASEDLLKAVREWEADLSDVTEDQVKAQLGLDGEQLPATSEPSLEEFFYDEDVEASLAAVEEREMRRAERGGGRFGDARGGRFGRGGRGEDRGRGRGGRFGASTRGGRAGRSGFFPADGDNYNRYDDDSRNNYQRTGDGWDRPPRRQQQDRDQTDSSSGGTGWYDGAASSTGGDVAFDDSTSGWFTGTGTGTNDNSTAFDDDIGWFRAEETATRSAPAPVERTSVGASRGDDGGLLSDDDDEFWNPETAPTGIKNNNKKKESENIKDTNSPAAPAATSAAAALDDLDAIWGAGMGGGEVDNIGGGWMSMDNDIPGNTTRDDAPTYGGGGGGGNAGGGREFREYRDRGERGSERGGRGEGRGGFRDRSEREFGRGDRGDRGRGRFGERSYDRERGGRGDRGRGGSFDEGSDGGRDGYTQREREDSRRSSYRDNNRSDFSSNDSGSRFSSGDDLSWWDAPTEKSAAGGGNGGSAGGQIEKSVEQSAAPSSSSSGYKAPQKSSNLNDGDDWFSDGFDADFGGSSKESGSRGGGGGGGGDGDVAASPPLSVGTKVEVVSGRFQDFEGVIVESKGERVKAELDVFGTPTVVEISRGEVEPFE